MIDHYSRWPLSRRLIKSAATARISSGLVSGSYRINSQLFWFFGAVVPQLCRFNSAWEGEPKQLFHNNNG
jgi:hypothetical protein